MPANFPEMWVNRVELNLTTATEAPWLAGITELDTSIVESGSGSASEINEIHIPVTDFEVDVLINNTAYPIALQEYDDDTVTIRLDKYQTKRVPISDDQAMGAAYRQIDAVTQLMTRGILIKKYGKAIWSLAPAADSEFTPVIKTTGRTDKFDAQGAPVVLHDGTRVRLVYDDLVDLKTEFDNMQIPASGRRLVLATDHWNDLLLDRKRFGDLLINYKTGDVAPIIAGFEIFSYINNPYFRDTTKLAYGVVPTPATDMRASVAYYTLNIAMKTGLTKQYYTPAVIDTANQANTLAYRHYFIVVPKRAKYLGAIVSAIFVPAA